MGEFCNIVWEVLVESLGPRAQGKQRRPRLTEPPSLSHEPVNKQRIKSCRGEKAHATTFLFLWVPDTPDWL